MFQPLCSPTIRFEVFQYLAATLLPVSFSGKDPDSSSEPTINEEMREVDEKHIGAGTYSFPTPADAISFANTSISIVQGAIVMTRKAVSYRWTS